MSSDCWELLVFWIGRLWIVSAFFSSHEVQHQRKPWKIKILNPKMEVDGR